MRHTLLSNLKLSMRGEEFGYDRCAASRIFPGYTYFISKSGRDRVEREANGLPQFELDGEGWLLAALGAADMDAFERALLKGTGDVRGVLSRLMIVPDTTAEPSDAEWLEQEPVKPSAPLFSVRNAESAPAKLPTVGEGESLTYAEYDAVIEMLKAKQYDSEVRKLLYLSVIETLNAAETSRLTRFDDVLDVLFANLLVAMQTMKNVNPNSAIRFMGYVMKTFVAKDARAAVSRE